MVNKDIHSLLRDKGFEELTLVKSGTIVSLREIYNQKKSPWGYINSKIHRVASITVNGKTHKFN